MPVYYTHRNREELQDLTQKVPHDILIPLNAGRTIKNPRRSGSTGQFYNERPANTASIRDWVNANGRLNVYEVADITERDALDDNDSEFTINKGDIAIVADADGLGNAATYIYTAPNTWTELIGGSSGGSGGGLALYSPLQDVVVRANKLGVTAVESAGTLDVTIPNTVEVYKLDYKGNQSNLDGSNNMTINFNYGWDNGYNTSYITTFTPIVQVWDRTLPTYNSDTVTENFYIRRVETNPPEVQITQSASNIFSIKLADLSMTNNWGISITL